MNNEQLKAKVLSAVDELIDVKGYVSPVDVLLKTEILRRTDYEGWRFGRVPYLEKVCADNLSKLTLLMKEIKRYSVYISDEEISKAKELMRKYLKEYAPDNKTS